MEETGNSDRVINGMPFYTRIWETKSEEDGNADGSGKLIEDAGLKGVSVGGAEVSSLHSGFIINTGGATATDILDLITLVRNRVYDESGIMLEPEVRIIG